MTMTAENSVVGIDDRPTNQNDSQEQKTGKLVALDIDGTLVDHDGKMSQAVQEAAAKASQDGHHLVIATGRSLGATLPIVEKIGVQRGYAVCCNGAVTLALTPDHSAGYQILQRRLFSPASALVALRDVLPTAFFALEDATGNFLSTSSFQDPSFGIRAKSVDFEELLRLEAVRVVVHSQDVPLDEFSAAVRGAGLDGVAYAVGWTSWLDIAAKGVTKATALEELRTRLHVAKADTVAVGDGFNDLQMLSWAARGVAMGQAADEVKAHANEVTASVYDDGAAAVLRTLN